MLYCEACQQFVAPQAIAECPECGEGLREIRPNDPVLFLSVPSLQATLVEPLLADSDIPYSKVGELGTGFTMRAGDILEVYRFYVPYGAYPQAHDLIAATFGADAVIMEGLL